MSLESSEKEVEPFMCINYHENLIEQCFLVNWPFSQ